MAVRLDSVERAAADLGSGRAVVVAAGETGRCRGHLTFAAALATPELVAFQVRHTSGYLCVPISVQDADRLDLPPMRRVADGDAGAVCAVTVDACEHMSTGISATDRARTIRLLADPDTRPTDLSRPGHVVPLRVPDGGVLRRAGHAEAAIDLAVLAGLRPAAAIADIVSTKNPVRMAQDDELRAFADLHGLAMISVAALADHRWRFDTLVDRMASARVPLPAGEFTAVGYASRLDGREHVAFVRGAIDDGADVLVSVHAECVTGDVFGSLLCGCGPRLHQALSAVARQGRGVVLYLRGSQRDQDGLWRELRTGPGRGHGPGAGHGLPADARDYGAGAQILADLGVKTIRLLSSDPAERAALESHGARVTSQSPLLSA